MGKQIRYIRSDMEVKPEERKLEGYFSVFGPAYEMGPGVRERIDPHAFDETLQEDAGDIRCLWNHNQDIVLGRTGNGTLSLRVDDHGLWGETTINPDDSDAMNALARVERGDVNQSSFGFEILEQEIYEREDEVEFVVTKARLWEVSPVTFPAYKETSISSRQADAADHRKVAVKLRKAKIKEKLNGIKEATR